VRKSYEGGGGAEEARAAKFRVVHAAPTSGLGLPRATAAAMAWTNRFFFVLGRKFALVLLST